MQPSGAHDRALIDAATDAAPSAEPQATLGPVRPSVEAGLRVLPAALPDFGLGIQYEVHDREQLEIRFNYGLGHDTGAQLFKVDTYLFIPKNVGVNKANYSKAQFYADVTALMRLDAAPLPLEQLADPSFRASPLGRIREGLQQFRSSARPPPSLPLAVHVKLYAYLHTEAVKNEVRRLKELLAETSGPGPGRAAFQQALQAALGRFEESLWAFRKIRTCFWPFEKLCHSSLIEAMRWADEYMSVFLEERLAALTAALDADPRRLDGSCFVPKAKAAINELASAEEHHRRRYGYLTLGGLHGEESAHREYFTYRLSLLKKAVHQALYLDAREVSSDTYVRNAIGAVGAALAAIWALATQLPSAVADLPSNTKLLFMTLAVLAYVAKDRIKAMTNDYLTRRFRKYDHTHGIYGASLEPIGLGMMRTQLRESMRFLTWDEVRESIRRIRLERRTVRQLDAITNNEEVIYYRKSLRIEPEDESVRLPEGYGVRDILRLNIRHFLVRLDDPSEKVRYFDPERGAFTEGKLPKVYHLNVVLRLRRKLSHGETLERFEHLRVVLNKNGILRVERVGA
jgi:hypothetical protein